VEEQLLQLRFTHLYAINAVAFFMYCTYFVSWHIKIFWHNWKERKQECPYLVCQPCAHPCVTHEISHRRHRTSVLFYSIPL